MNRLAEQVQADAEAVAPVSAKMAGRAVLLIPHRSDAADEGALPGDYRKILSIVREADGPVQVRAVGERLGLDASVRGKLEPLRAKMTKLADRGWLHKRGEVLSIHDTPSGKVGDGRRDQGQLYPVAAVLALAASSVVAGIRSFAAIGG